MRNLLTDPQDFRLAEILAGADLGYAVQPIVRLGAGRPRLRFCEWLLRPHSGAGAAQYCEAINSLGLERALDRRVTVDAMRWLSSLEHPVRLSINLNAASMESTAFLQLYTQCLALTGVPADHIYFEISDPDRVQSIERAQSFAFCVRHRGGRIGFHEGRPEETSSGDLGPLPAPDFIKLDRRLVWAACAGGYAQKKFQECVRSSRRRGAAMVAEGVETLEHHDLLERHQVRLAQGFLYKRPVPSAVFANALRARRKRQDSAAA